MSGLAKKPCTGFRCEDTAGCPYFAVSSPSTFEYMSPLATHEVCPHWPPAHEGWGDGKLEPTA